MPTRPAHPSFVFHLLSFVFLLALSACSSAPQSPYPPGLTPKFLMFSDDLSHDLSQWTLESEPGARVQIARGQLEIDTPAGCTLWFNQPLGGPLLIQFTATMVQAGGPNDRVSDLNCFWMADDTRSPGNLLDYHRSGALADYDLLKTYYVGLGGNANTTTRFRRYIGQANNRPLDPKNDLKDPQYLLTPNIPNLIQLVASGPLIQYYRNGKKRFELTDPNPYTQGWFAFRTTQSHILIRDFRVYRL